MSAHDNHMTYSSTGESKRVLEHHCNQIGGMAFLKKRNRVLTYSRHFSGVKGKNTAINSEKEIQTQSLQQLDKLTW